MTVYDGGGSGGDVEIPNFLPIEGWMAGTVTTYNATTGVLVAAITSKSGTLTYASWNIHRAPTPGSSSLLVGTSVTSLAIGTGAKTLTTATGLSLVPGDSIYIIYASATGLNATGMILYLAAQQLKDETGIEWDVSVLVPYLNLFIMEVINLKPEAAPDTRVLQLVAGAVQSLPATAISMIDAVCNMGAGGATRGAAIDTIKKETMDSLIPGWMTYTASGTVQFVVLDDRTPKRFYVFPPQPAVSPEQIEVVLSMPPTPLTEIDGTFPFDNSYIPAAIDYLVFRSLAEENSIPNALNKSLTYRGLFLQGLGVKAVTEKETAAKGA